MFPVLVIAWLLCFRHGLAEDPTTPSTVTTLAEIYRQARSDPYYARRYASERAALTSSPIGVRADAAAAVGVEPRDSSYYESRCITCDPNKSAVADKGGWRQRPRYDWYDDDFEDRRYRDRYEDDRDRDRYYDRPRAPVYDPDQRYDRYDRPSPYERPYGRTELPRPLYLADGYDPRYDSRPYERPHRLYDRGNGYDNLDPRYPYEDSRYERGPSYGYRRPLPEEPPVYPLQDRGRYDRFDRYDPYERHPYRRYPAAGGSSAGPDDRYDRYGARGSAPDGRERFYGSSNWGPGYDRGYASAWNYAGSRGDNWRDMNRDRDIGVYRPRDYFYDSTAAPGGSRGTGYLHDRPESSTKADSIDRDKATNSPQPQDNKGYKD